MRHTLHSTANLKGQCGAGRACKGVCPSVSRSGRVSDTGWSGGSSVMIIFNTLACRPACSRTPDASYMTCTPGDPSAPCLLIRVRKCASVTGV